MTRLLITKFSGRTEPGERAASATDQAADPTEASSESYSFLYTVGHRRADGTYVVERRNADSAGHRKVFESVAAVDRLLMGLPREFTAADLTRSGLTGGRRHLVLRHLVEHPRWDCDLVARQPLTARRPTASDELEGVPAD
ncbi:MAG: hypothetical protein ABEJ35_02995 [Halobacteriaceae archaeon]